MDQQPWTAVVTPGRGKRVTAKDIDRLYWEALDRGADPVALTRQRDELLKRCGGDMDRLAAEWNRQQLMDEFVAAIGYQPPQAARREADLRQLKDLVARYPREAGQMVRKVDQAGEAKPA